MKILIAGDFCPSYRVSEAFYSNNYDMVLSEVARMTARADYSIVNFECPVVTMGAEAIKKIGPNLQCSTHGIEALKYAGFDCVTLANNHFRDFGDEGVGETLQTLKKYNIEYVGGGMDAVQASKILYKEIEDKKLAIINCCEHEFSIATDHSAGSNPLNLVRQYYDIKEAKTHADYVLVIVHGGHEHFQLPSPRMVETYRFFIDAGADAVVNHHQHCFSGYELYNKKPIFYGTGNFCFDDNKSINTIWNEGYMVMLSFDKEISFQLFPYSQCSSEPVVNILKDTAYNDRIEQLNAIIQDEELLKIKVQEYYRKCEKQSSSFLEPLSNRFFQALRRRGMFPSLISSRRKLMATNQINCESHCDKLRFYLNDTDL